jgi:ATP-dependent RNA helicase DHX33
MSATMDVDHFSDYFGSVPIIYLEGRQHPVEIFQTKQTQDDYQFSCLVTIFQIHQDAPAKYVYNKNVCLAHLFTVDV